jgi:RNA polymerase sigma-70 factor (sigma-E family)
MTTMAQAGRTSVEVPDFDSWVAARGPALLRLAYVLTGNGADAEDVVQDALSRALPRWSRISTVDDPDAYVRRMVVNAHVSRWRKLRRREVPVEVVHDRPVPAGVGAEDRDRLWRACQALPPDQRTAVVLRFYEDLDYAEIAALTGVREGSVRSRVSRGIAAMRHELGEQDDE